MCIFRKKGVFSTGAIPSPADHRDLLLSQIAEPIDIWDLPSRYKVPYKLDVLDQDGRPACVGYSAASLKAFQERREQHPLDFDGDWLYRKCKKIDGIPNEQGTFLRTVFKVLKHQGAKPLNVDDSPLKYRIGAYARLDDVSFGGLKKAIFQWGVIQVGFRGSNEGWQTKNIRPPKTGEKTWGHAVALVGYGENYLIGLNSWGTKWGDGGLFYVPKNYTPFEGWAIINDLPDDFQIQEKPKHCFEKPLNYGEKSNDVKWLQRCLKSIGIFPVAIDETGFYGKITSLAVYNFQTTYNVASQSELDYLGGKRVGPKTLKKLNEIFCSKVNN